MKSALLSIPCRAATQTDAEESTACPTNVNNTIMSDIDIAMAEELMDRGKFTTTNTRNNRNNFASALSSSVVVLDAKLGVNPMKEVPFVRSAVDFLVGVTRESKGSLEVVVRMESNGGGGLGIVWSPCRKPMSAPRRTQYHLDRYM